MIPPSTISWFRSAAKSGAGRLFEANERVRVLRPFDVALADEKGKIIIPARHLNFVGGYAGLWKVTFDQSSVRGQLLQGTLQRIQFDAKLHHNLEFSAKFQAAKLNALRSAAGGR